MIIFNNLACSVEVDLYASGRLSLALVHIEGNTCFIPEVLCQATIDDNSVKLANNEIIITNALEVFHLLEQANMIEKVVRSYKNHGLIVKITPELEKEKKRLLKKIK